MKISYLLTLGIVATFFVGSDYAFAANVNIPQGTSVPGCEAANQCYIPYEVSVPAGGQVVWKNNDSAAHTVTSGSSADGPSGVFDSSLLMAGTTFTHNFSQDGVYPYFCMVHPWMNGIVLVGDYDDSDWSAKDPITVIMNDSEFYLDQSNQVVRANVEFRDFSPSDGQYFMKVTHLSTGKAVKNSEIYPKAAGNDLYSVQIAYPLSESDMIVGGVALLGEYEIQIYSDKGANTGSARFSILETAPKAEPVSVSKVVIDAEINKKTFDEDEMITVTGSVNNVLHGNTVSVRLLSPTGDIILIQKTFLDEDGNFSYNARADNVLFEKNGDYTISLIYGIQEIRKDLSFSYVGNPLPKPEPVPDPEPIPTKETSPVVDQEPKVTTPIPKTQEITKTTIEKPDSVKQMDSIVDYTLILILAAIVVAGAVGGVFALKKRSKGKGDSSTSSNTKHEKSKDEMKWEGI